ncbi:MAG TPA: response regulator [Candidatus Thermoplasmatota archaeon]|nr:response regulator [Candidatus Thermoplasmatota archaeon]
MPRILLIDADEVRRARARHALGAIDRCEVDEAPTHLDAIRLAARGRPDLIVLAADGDARPVFLDALRALAPGARVLVMGRVGGEAAALLWLSRGACDLLSDMRHLELELAERARPLLALSGNALAPRLAPLPPIDA